MGAAVALGGGPQCRWVRNSGMVSDLGTEVLTCSRAGKNPLFRKERVCAASKVCSLRPVVWSFRNSPSISSASLSLSPLCLSLSLLSLSSSGELEMLRRTLSPLLSIGARRAFPLLRCLPTFQSAAAQSLGFSSQILNPSNPQVTEADGNPHDYNPKASISIDRSGLYNPPGLNSSFHFDIVFKIPFFFFF